MARSLTRNRLVAVLTSALLVGLLVAACGSSSTRQSSDGPDMVGPTGATAPVTTDTTFGPVSGPGPSMDPGSASASTTPGGAIDCGTFDLAVGWPTTFVPPASMYDCLGDAFRAGTPARLVLSAQTDGDGGAPVTTTYLVTGQGIVHVTTDATRAVGRPPVVSAKDCRSLDPTRPEPTVSNCENMAN
jgi:hypothetical protein